MDSQDLVWKDRSPRGCIVFLVCLCIFKNCSTYKHLLSSFLLHCTLRSLWICPYLSFFVLHNGASGYCRAAKVVYCFPSVAVCYVVEDWQQCERLKKRTIASVHFISYLGLFLCGFTSQCKWIDSRTKMEDIFLCGTCSILREYFSLKLDVDHRTTVICRSLYREATNRQYIL